MPWGQRACSIVCERRPEKRCGGTTCLRSFKRNGRDTASRFRPWWTETSFTLCRADRLTVAWPPCQESSLHFAVRELFGLLLIVQLFAECTWRVETRARLYWGQTGASPRAQTIFEVHRVHERVLRSRMRCGPHLLGDRCHCRHQHGGGARRALGIHGCFAPAVRMHD